MLDEPQVLVIDDETGSRESMAIAVEKAGFHVRTFDDARKALEFLDQNTTVQLVLCDLRMPGGMDGLAFLQEVRRRALDLSVILVTGFGSIESAVEAMRVGADDYLTKPVDLFELRKRVKTHLDRRQLAERVRELGEQLDKRYGFESIIGRSASMEALFEQMKLVAPTRSNVLIIGESGTGKELVANALHRASPRRDERFLAINCGAIPSDILESELFGHERGSFTGAIGRKIGKFELAHRGTLFLDEISELYPELQVKLLRVLEERQIMRVGGGELIDVDFRLIAATNKDLEKEIADGRFREDLYYRLKVATLRIPPLRERSDDIGVIAEHYLRQFCREHGREEKRIARETAEALRAYSWPGNVRELKNAMESVAVFHRGEVVEPEDLPSEIGRELGIEIRPFVVAGPATAALSEVTALPESPGPAAHAGVDAMTMADIEREAILTALERAGGRRVEAARALDIGLRTLQRKLREYRDQGFYEE
ncbi:MAG: sigma-54-dependent Fis family transcriptional regulator [Thermoanaerobaculia bacterium]|nr:MAG: sigma-54-dependent Fis family transcriptional regulator [Thermoanaerobaculia bacterium]MBZ0100541.1 sigma-54 dependent transcriptional regulator [Thermoanaerobaculia bacterium]